MNSGTEIIDGNTIVKTLLDAKQEEVINALIKLNKNFRKLRNPFLRKLLARRVRVADACKVANCTISDFLKAMQQIGFTIAETAEPASQAQATFTNPPEQLVTEFDVRPILAANQDPLKEILKKTQQLKKGEYLRIINTFEPTPLITLLNQKGFQSHSYFAEPELSITYFFKSNDQPENETSMETFITGMAGFEETMLKYRGKLKEIDVTGLEMPLPMHTILGELKNIRPGEALFVHHKKIPVYLLPNLHDEGFEYLIREEEAGKVSMLIYKP